MCRNRVKFWPLILFKCGLDLDIQTIQIQRKNQAAQAGVSSDYDYHSNKGIEMRSMVNDNETNHSLHIYKLSYFSQCIPILNVKIEVK